MARSRRCNKDMGLIGRVLFERSSPFVPAKAGAPVWPVSLARNQPLSSPRRRGPITTKVWVIARPCHIAMLRRMGPRLRGDDKEESLLHTSEAAERSFAFAVK